MIEIREVKTRSERKEFVEFPLRLYKNNDCFVPPLYADEMKMFKSDYVYYDKCEAAYYLAVENGKTVGRISAILQKSSNEIRNEKRVRFTRFDSIDSEEVSSALFDAVEAWARLKGMDTVCGPLGFSDLEREGLLVEGFDELSTFEEQYNYEYYGRLIEAAGYIKEVDWVESKLYLPEKTDDRLSRISALMMKKYNLHFGKSKNTNDFLKKYGEKFFDLLDETYSKVYGTVPFTEGMKIMLMDNFRMIIDIKHVAAILDENEQVVCFGICFPSIARAVQPSGGRLTPPTLIRLLKAIKKPQIIDLGLVGVKPEYALKGISSAIIAAILDMLKDPHIKYAETNLNLEDNYAIQNQWKNFRAVRHKRRRAYVKKLA